MRKITVDYIKKNHPGIYAAIHSKGVRCQKSREYVAKRRAWIRELVNSRGQEFTF